MKKSIVFMLLFTLFLLASNKGYALQIDTSSRCELIVINDNRLGDSYIGETKIKLFYGYYATDYGISTSQVTTYNKKTEIDVDEGTTTIYGYVKDSDGKELKCSTTVKVINSEVNYDYRYAYKIFDTNEYYEMNNIIDFGGIYITDNNNKITYRNLNRFKDIDKIIITLKDKSEKDFDILLTYYGDKKDTINTKVLKGTKNIIIDIPKSTYSTIEFNFSSNSILTGYLLENIELLSTNGSSLTNQDVGVYIFVDNDELINDKYIFENNFDGNLIVKKSNKLKSISKHISITGIDKLIPSGYLIATKKNSKQIVTSGEWSNEGLDFELSIEKNGFSGASIYYCQDTNNTCIPETKYNNKIITKYNIIEGSYYIRYRFVSNSNAMSEIYSYKANVDTKKPNATIKVIKQKNKEVVNNGEWSNDRILFKIYEKNNYSDFTIRYCEDLDNTCIPIDNKNDGEYIDTNNNNDNYYIRYQVVSKSGIVSNIESFNVKIDKEEPIVELNIFNSQMEKIDHIYEWQNDYLSFQFINSSRGISKKTIYYCMDMSNTCEPNIKVDSNEIINDYNNREGIYYIRYKITNESGLTSMINSYEAKVDIKAADVGIRAISNKKVVNNNTWVDDGVSFEFYKNNNYSNSKIYYCMDLDNTCIPDTSIKENELLNKYIDNKGIYYIRYNSINEALVRSEIKSFTVKVDESKPEVLINVTDGKKEIESNNWVTTDLHFDFKVKNIGESEVKIYYCVDKENKCIPSKDYFYTDEIINSNGISYIRYYLINGSNYYTDVKTYVAKVDKIKPTCSIFADKKEWTNENVSIKINIDDVGPSMIDSYSWDGKYYDSQNETIIENNQVVNAYIKNGAGVVSTCSIDINYIDKEKPKCELTLDGIKNEEVYVSDVTVKFKNVNDNKIIDKYGLIKIEGNKEINHSKNSNTLTTYTGYIKDKAGNTNTCDISFKKNSKLLVSYDNNGGSLCSSKETYYGEEYGALCVPVRTGYTFDGWYLDDKLIDEKTIVTTINDHTITAHWKTNNYTISFDNDSCNIITREYGEMIGKMCEPIKDNYQFAGWYRNVNDRQILLNETTEVNGNISASAKWIKEGYTITFNNNEGYGCSKLLVEKDQPVGSLCVPKKENNTFIGWYLIEDDIEKQINENTIIDKNIELFAKWKED